MLKLQQFIQRIRPALLPAAIVVFTIGLIFLLRVWSAMPRATEAMQVELNRQYERFQRQLSGATDAMVQMQQRMLQSEHMRDRLKELYEQAQRDLAQTQRALNAANLELLRAQAELSRVLGSRQDEAVEELADQPKPTPQEVAKQQAAAAARAEAELNRKIADLAALRKDSAAVMAAIADSRAYLDRLWIDYVEASRLIDVTDRTIARKMAQIEKREYRESPAFRPPAKPDSVEHVVVQPADLDLMPKLSSRMKSSWAEERINERSAELVALHGELTALNRLLEASSASLRELQQTLMAKQKQLRKME